MPRILAIDDDPQFLRSLAGLLQYKKYQVETLTDPRKAETVLRQNHFDCALVDVKMPGMGGIELLQQIQKLHPTLPVLMLSGESGTPIVVEAIKLGAYDFIEKPIDPERLLVSLRNALERSNLYHERELLVEELGSVHRMVGVSPQLKEAIRQAKQVAPFDHRVLITGESGTGKELIAHAIRLYSKRNTKPFIKINCAAIPSELLESELFGYRKGSFTGAMRDHKGKFLLADKGTLFLDEVGDLPLELQGKLLTVLQDGQVEVIGQAKPQKVDVRVIAATNHDLEKMVDENRFRADLYYRLNVFQIHLPPLRERKEDVPVLAEHFLRQFAETHNKVLRGFAPESLRLLQQYDWPGNVRELQNVVTKVAIFADSAVIQPGEIAQVLNLSTQTGRETAAGQTLEQARQNFEREFILRVFEQTGGRMLETAQQLGINRSALYKKMRKLGIYHQEGETPNKPQNGTSGSAMGGPANTR
ncbi:MAG: sigma-54 dependent transcriptional regulator [Calditrichia bacterium]